MKGKWKYIFLVNLAFWTTLGMIKIIGFNNMYYQLIVVFVFLVLSSVAMYYSLKKKVSAWDGVIFYGCVVLFLLVFPYSRVNDVTGDSKTIYRKYIPFSEVEVIDGGDRFLVEISKDGSSKLIGNSHFRNLLPIEVDGLKMDYVGYNDDVYFSAKLNNQYLGHYDSKRSDFKEVVKFIKDKEQNR
ncbi:MAG: hypothetical protein WBO70_07250 [Erysipelotrichaceae bacterium]